MLTAKKQNIILPFTFLLLIISAAFLPSLANSFAEWWDDGVYVINNPIIRDFSARNIYRIFATFQLGFYHPVTLFSYALEYNFFGLNPHAYHATNLILHLFNSSLVFFMFLLISDKVIVAFITAVLFGIHPLHVESVAWISERKDVLSTFFFLGALILYLLYLDKREKKYYVMTVIASLLSFLTKPTAVGLPVILLLLDFIKRRKFDRSIITDKLIFLGISVVFGAMAYLAEAKHGAVRHEFALISFDKAVMASYSLLLYIGKTLLPAKLSCVYPYPSKIGGQWPLFELLSPALVLVMFAAAAVSLKKTRKIFFGSMFFLITILPVLQIVPVTWSFAGDRYTYIPLIGLFYIFGEGAARIYYEKFNASPAGRTILIAALAALICVLSVKTWQRCKVWKDSITLWNDAIGNYPTSPTSFNNRGLAYASKREIEKAAADFEAALRLNPDYLEVFNNRGNMYFSAGRYDEAIADYNKVLARDPDNVDAHNNRGSAYASMGQYDKAIADFTKVLELNPRHAHGYNNLGNVYHAKGDINAAVSYYNKALDMNPDNIEAYNNRGYLYATAKEYDRAIADYSQAIKISPTCAQAYNNRANAYANKGEMAKAVSDYSAAIRINPYYGEAYGNRGHVLFMCGEYARAREDVNSAAMLGVKVNPKLIEELKKVLKE